MVCSVAESVILDVGGGLVNLLDDSKYENPIYVCLSSIDPGKYIFSLEAVHENYVYMELVSGESNGKKYSSGIGVEFNKAEWNEYKRTYEKGTFKVFGHTKVGDSYSRVAFEHGCKTGKETGVEGGLFVLANLMEVKKQIEGVHGRDVLGPSVFYQVMPHSLKAIYKSQEKLGIEDNLIRDAFYEVCFTDLKNTVNLVGDVKGDAGFYPLGATMVNTLNMYLSHEQVRKVLELVNHKIMIPKFEQIIKEDSDFINTGFVKLEFYIDLLRKGKIGRNGELKKDYFSELREKLIEKFLTKIKYTNVSEALEIDQLYEELMGKPIPSKYLKEPLIQGFEGCINFFKNSLKEDEKIRDYPHNYLESAVEIKKLYMQRVNPQLPKKIIDLINSDFVLLLGAEFGKCMQHDFPYNYLTQARDIARFYKEFVNNKPPNTMRQVIIGKFTNLIKRDFFVAAVSYPELYQEIFHEKLPVDKRVEEKLLKKSILPNEEDLEKFGEIEFQLKYQESSLCRSILKQVVPKNPF